MTLFSNMMSGMLQCSCGAQLFYDEHLEAKGVAHTCWNAERQYKYQIRLSLERTECC